MRRWSIKKGSLYNNRVTNQEIVQLLRNMAAALLIKGENRFRIIAYEKAADSVEHLTSELKDYWDEGKLKDVPGIGDTLASHIDELFRTGKVAHFERTFHGLSPALFTFLLIPGIGPKRAHRLTQEFHITDPKTAVAELEQVAKSGKIAVLPGWGEKSQSEVLAAIEAYKKGQIKEKRMNLPFADVLAQEVIAFVYTLPGVKQVDVLGSLRRKVATIGDIDLAAATIYPEKTAEQFVRYPKVKKIIDQGPKGATVLLSVGRQVDLRVQQPVSYGSMLQYFTGSKNHNIRLREFALKQGLSLSEHGIKVIGKSKILNPKSKNYNKDRNIYEYDTEEGFYNAVGLPWIPPEIREDRGEIEIALQGKLPHLVETSDLKGDLHIHSNYDLQPSHDVGSSSFEELLDEAAGLGYEYIGISDHNPSLGNHSESEVVEILHKRREMFEHIYNSWSKRVKPFNSTQGNRVQMFIMLEVDILPTGKLALPEKAFAYVDAVVISVHSRFDMSREAMTKRILNGLSHPKAKIVGHPTGRLLGSRESYEVNWEKIFEFCKNKQKALEINSWPERLDLPDMLVYEAVKKGVQLIISTDSHDKKHMQLMPFGVSVARRGWAQPQDILNTLPYNEFKKWLEN